MDLTGIPVRRFEMLHHVGTLDTVWKRDMSWEGMGVVDVLLAPIGNRN